MDELGLLQARGRWRSKVYTTSENDAHCTIFGPSSAALDTDSGRRLGEGRTRTREGGQPVAEPALEGQDEAKHQTKWARRLVTIQHTCGLAPRR
jgi:hypothetical protein